MNRMKKKMRKNSLTPTRTQKSERRPIRKSSFWRFPHEKFSHFMYLIAIHSSLSKHVAGIIVIDWCCSQQCVMNSSEASKNKKHFRRIRKNKGIYEWHSYLHVLHFHPSFVLAHFDAIYEVLMVSGKILFCHFSYSLSLTYTLCLHSCFINTLSQERERER